MFGFSETIGAAAVCTVCGSARASGFFANSACCVLPLLFVRIFVFFFWVFFVCVSFSDESWCSLGSHSTLDFFFNTFSCASSDGGYAVRDNILFVGFAFLFNAGYFPQFFRLFLRLRYISVFLELNATSTSTTSKLADVFFFLRILVCCLCLFRSVLRWRSVLVSWCFQWRLFLVSWCSFSSFWGKFSSPDEFSKHVAAFFRFQSFTPHLLVVVIVSFLRSASACQQLPSARCCDCFLSKICFCLPAAVLCRTCSCG